MAAAGLKVTLHSLPPHARLEPDRGRGRRLDDQPPPRARLPDHHARRLWSPVLEHGRPGRPGDGSDVLPGAHGVGTFGDHAGGNWVAISI